MTPADVRDAAARLVARTCEAQGLPALIVDPAALARMAAFLVPATAERAGTTSGVDRAPGAPAASVPDVSAATPAASGRSRRRAAA